MRGQPCLNKCQSCLFIGFPGVHGRFVCVLLSLLSALTWVRYGMPRVQEHKKWVEHFLFFSINEDWARGCWFVDFIEILVTPNIIKGSPFQPAPAA